MNVLGKPLPFKGGAKFPQAVRPSYGAIIGALRKNSLRAAPSMTSPTLCRTRTSPASVRTATGSSLRWRCTSKADKRRARDRRGHNRLLPPPRRGGRGRHEKVKTIGKMLDEKYCIEGACPVVIDCIVQDGEHMFVTKNDGTNLAKAPMGSLPEDDGKRPQGGRHHASRLLGRRAPGQRR